jgi:hypothetical protein
LMDVLRCGFQNVERKRLASVTVLRGGPGTHNPMQFP